MKSVLQEGRDQRTEWVCLCFKVREKEGGRVRERNNISWREGKDCRDWTTQVSSQDSVELQELCLFGGERGGFSLTSAAAGLRRGSAWQPRRDRSHSMGHSASSETVAQQQAQHNTGESKARRSALNSCHEHTFD